MNASAGGGGAGLLGGQAGATNSCGVTLGRDATPAQAGSLLTGGLPGKTWEYPYGWTLDHGVTAHGGKGGDLGQPGAPGEARNMPGGLGGLSGIAITGISFLQAGSVLGDVRGTAGLNLTLQRSGSFSYKINTLNITGDPGAGFLLYNNTTPTSATQINVSHMTSDVHDVDSLLAQVAVSQEFVIQDTSNTANYQQWKVVGAPININPGQNNSYWTIPVNLVAKYGTLSGATTVSLNITYGGSGSADANNDWYSGPVLIPNPVTSSVSVAAVTSITDPITLSVSPPISNGIGVTVPTNTMSPWTLQFAWLTNPPSPVSSNYVLGNVVGNFTITATTSGASTGGPVTATLPLTVTYNFTDSTPTQDLGGGGNGG